MPFCPLLVVLKFIAVYPFILDKFRYITKHSRIILFDRIVPTLAVEIETNPLFIKLHGTRAGQALTYEDVDSRLTLFSVTRTDTQKKCMVSSLKLIK